MPHAWISVLGLGSSQLGTLQEHSVVDMRFEASGISDKCCPRVQFVVAIATLSKACMRGYLVATGGVSQLYFEAGRKALWLLIALTN